MIKKHFLIVEALLQREEGLTRNEINEILEDNGEKALPRHSFIKAINSIAKRTGISIVAHDYGKNVWRYRIDRQALEDYDRDQVLGNLIANMMQADFLLEFRDLGSKIQPLIIARGTEYLRPIGTALRGNYKLQVTYQKFDEEPYDAVLHPYCLKVFGGRWYLFAFKENSEHPNARMQCFSLDRIKAIKVMKECFVPDSSIDPQEYFRDAFGIWVDNIGHPAEDVIVACTRTVANYLRSLPLHHSQKEITREELPADLKHLSIEGEAGRETFFAYHISLTPDFIGELNRWGDQVVLLKSQSF